METFILTLCFIKSVNLYSPHFISVILDISEIYQIIKILVYALEPGNI